LAIFIEDSRLKAADRQQKHNFYLPIIFLPSWVIDVMNGNAIITIWHQKMLPCALVLIMKGCFVFNIKLKDKNIEKSN